MLLALVLTLLSAIYLGVVILVGAGLYKDPVLHQFERYAERDDGFYLLPPLLLGIGLIALFGGFLFSATVAPRYPALLMGLIFLFIAYFVQGNTHFMKAHPELFLAFPRWYVDLRERTTREERRHIAYMWLCLPRSARLHYNGSDHHFLLWTDYVILATVTQTVEDQEAIAAERPHVYND
ncbi:MAG: hypothetical protein ABI835_03100 [Chloroflexota bacterium]